jgi:hypothetical protein
MTQAKKYQRCMVMAGGGLRFGIYLGMVAAMRAAGRAPDLLLASCGGAIAAAIIAALPDDEQRKQWLSSPQMYQFWCEMRSSDQAGIVRSLVQAARRKFSRANAATIPDLFQDYLFELPAQLPLPPGSGDEHDVAVAIIGGKLLFSRSEVGQVRGARKLFAETVFCGHRSASLLRGMASPMSDARWGDNAIAPDLLTDTSMPLAMAARISIADMYYLPCHRHGEEDYIGGVLDLFPIELAHRLADEVIMEFKQEFDQTFAIPAWRAVLGVDGNERLRHVNCLPVDVRIDTSDITQALARQSAQQKLDWRRNRIGVAMAADYATYVGHMNDQWDYGYRRAMEACKRQDQRAMRQMNKYNMAR